MIPQPQHSSPPEASSPDQHAGFWENRYLNSDTPWDRGFPHPEIPSMHARHPFAGNLLLPGCGSGHDARLIASFPSIHSITGVDISPTAVNHARSFPNPPSIAFQLGDFLATPADPSTRYDAIFEHTCFCAIPPSLRQSYALATATSIRPGGLFHAIFFLNPDMPPDSNHPPFGTSTRELDQLFLPFFDLLAEWIPASTHPGREQRELCRIHRRRSSSPSAPIIHASSVSTHSDSSQPSP